MEKDGHVKWTDKIKKCSCTRKSGRSKSNAGTIKKRKRNWLLADPLAKNEVPAKDCSRRNSNREEGSRQKKISDDRQDHDK